MPLELSLMLVELNSCSQNQYIYTNVCEDPKGDVTGKKNVSKQLK